MSPLGCQEFWDHQRLPLAFWLRGQPTVLMSLACLPLVILIECWLVICDEDEWKWMRRTCECCANIRIIPNMEMLFVFGPLIDKHVSIGHHIVSFVAINIHPIWLVSVLPVQFCKPTLCHQQWDAWFLDTKLQEHALNWVTHNNLTQILCLDKTCFCLFRQSFLDFLCNTFVFKSCGLFIAIGMEGKLPLLNKLDNPLLNIVCSVWTSTLCLCNNHQGLPPGVWKVYV